MAVLSVFDENSDVLVYTTESGHYCIMVNSARNIRLNDDGMLDATPIYGPFDNDTFVCETWPEAKKKLANIAEAGYRVDWGSGDSALNGK